MYSGVFSADELTRVFRSISQKRRQGVLEIQLGSHSVFISFHNGKIVDAGQLEKPSTLAICERLMLCGKMTSDQRQELLDEGMSIANLCGVLVEKGVCTKEEFLAAKTVFQMDTLYSLRKASRGHYEFTPKMTRNEEEYSLNLAPGQLLLDMMELDSEEGRYAGVIAALSAKDTRIVAANQGMGQLSTGEEALYSVLEESSCLEEICQRTLLTEYQLRAALLALFDKKLLKVEKKEERKEPSRPIVREAKREPQRERNLEEKAALKRVVDRSVSAEMIDDVAQLLSGLEEEPRDEDTLSDLDLNLPEEAASADLEIGESFEDSYLAEDEETENEETEEETAALLENADDEVDDEITEQMDPPQDFLENLGGEDASSGEEQLSLTERIKHFNFWMLQPDNFSNVALIINLLFLFAVSMIAPTLFNQWFDALSFFNEY